MLGQRRKRWPNIKPTLGRRICLQGECGGSTTYPAETRRLINVGLTLVHRLRRWTNVNPTLIQRLVSAGQFYTSHM